jgi:tRNA threonylcarbamoyladenosine biosynthesis protein TsaE
LGWDEAREGIVLVEWPERLGPLTPPEALRIHLTQGAAEDARHVVLSGWDARLGAFKP